MKKQTSFNPYPKEMLPEGFSYPKSYLDLSKNTSSINWNSEFMFQVIVIDLGNTKNMEYFNNFNEWLEIVEQNGWIQ